MSKWDRMDNIVWESSEVMQELEKIYKKSQNKDLVKKLQEAGQAAATYAAPMQQASKAVKDLNNAMQGSSAAKDGEVTKKRKKRKISKKQHNEAKDRLLNELNELANTASNKLDHKLSYAIERAINSITEEG
jgi:hypothetical protein